MERAPAMSSEEAGRIAAALIGRADAILFPGWPEQEHVDIELFRDFTVLLAKNFPALGLHARDQDFVSRCIKLLRRAGYRATGDD
jgi:hypothetical protein